ncbi:MAG: energy transducer TonB [Xanthomonadales bacterium]|jgi:protein TonB|nr:energy transducer TonB [Xanthomonadales bacterium]
MEQALRLPPSQVLNAPGAHRQRLFVASLSGLIGFSAVFGAILLMNQQTQLKALKSGGTATTIQAERRERPKAEQQVQRREPPKRTPPRSAPAPNLAGAGLDGLDFGLPTYGQDDLGDVAGNLLGDARNTVMTDDAVDVAPRPILQPSMPYPPRAKAQGLQGYVLLSVLISPTGSVERVKVLEADPPGVFDDVAVAGVQQWKFEPAQYQGEAVRVWARQRVRFGFN